MTDFLVDSNVILDLLTEDPHWFDCSSAQLADCAQTGTLHINPIIYAEVSIGFKDVTEVESVLFSSFFQRDALPYEAAFLAGQAFLQYRRRKRNRVSSSISIPSPRFNKETRFLRVGNGVKLGSIPYLMRHDERTTPTGLSVPNSRTPRLSQWGRKPNPQPTSGTA